MPASRLDGNQVLQHSYDESTGRLKVDAEVTATVGTMDVVIDAAGGDNIKISDGVDTLLINADGSLNSRPVKVLYTTRLDDTSTPNITYVGEAAIGSATGNAVWRIKRIDETTGVIILWADGNSNFDNIWDNRVGLSYS
jgi:hypothetical protein